MSYTELKITCDPDLAEIFMAELGNCGFETFTEEPFGLLAYIPDNELDTTLVEAVFERYRPVFAFTYSYQNIAKQNWNATWEQNYAPIRVGTQVLVRASFHDNDPTVSHQIIINPKMSFGTGHHETTHMMLQLMLQLSFTDKTVLDIGCGTGILAILAAKLGASAVAAFDIEDWAAENSRENVNLNNCAHIAVRQGTIETEPKQTYNILLANINRNILLRDIAQYVQFMTNDAQLLVSGFYVSDQPDIEAHFATFGLAKTAENNKNNWACVCFSKKT
jgi:ribosomal protein L11 methyltransferase